MSGRTQPEVGRSGRMAARSLWLTLLLAHAPACCLYGERPLPVVRAHTAPIPDATKRTPAVGLAGGLQADGRDVLLDGMVELVAVSRRDEDLRQAQRAKFADFHAAVFAELARPAPVMLADLQASGRIGRLFPKTEPFGVPYQGHDARYLHPLRPDDIVVLASEHFAFAFYRIPPDATAARPEELLEEPVGGFPYTHVLVLDSAVVISRSL